MSGCLGLAFYGIGGLSPELALKEGVSLFSMFGLEVKSACYYIYLAQGDHDGDHDVVEVHVDTLEEKIRSGDVSAFRIYHENGDIDPWVASYGYSTNEFGNFPHIDVQVALEPEKAFELAVKFLKGSQLVDKCGYGIGYGCGSVSKAFSYGSVHDLIKLYDFEETTKFKSLVRRASNCKDEGVSARLRMIYPLNVLSKEHLLLRVKDGSLEEWVEQNKKIGSLERVGKERWLWSVKEEALECVNKYLGELGVLLSWRSRPAKGSLGKRLP